MKSYRLLKVEALRILAVLDDYLVNPAGLRGPI